MGRCQPNSCRDVASTHMVTVPSVADVVPFTYGMVHITLKETNKISPYNISIYFGHTERTMVARVRAYGRML